MDLSIFLFIAILVLAFILFSTERYPLEISALLIMILLVCTGIIDTESAFSSFGNPGIFLIGSLFVLTTGLRKTGLIKLFEEKLFLVSGSSRSLTFGLILVIVAALSAFVSNTATLAVTIPIVVSLAAKFGDSPRLWLMPLGFASVLGGMNTLVGTSTNIIISSLLPRYDIAPFSLFTTANVGIPIAIIGVIMLLVLSKPILSRGEDRAAQTIEKRYDLRSYTVEVEIEEESPLCGKTFASTSLFRDAHVTALGLVRKGHPMMVPRGSMLLEAGDRIIVEGDINRLADVIKKYGVTFHEHITESASEEEIEEKKKDKTKTDYDLNLTEVIVTARSLLNNRTAKEVLLRARYRISLVAINRQGDTLRDKLSDVRIMSGDILVVQFLDPVEFETLDFLGLVALQELTQERYRTNLAPLAAAIFMLSLLIGSVSDLPLALTALAGSVVMVMTGIILPSEIYEAIEWKVLIFIGAVLCLGKAMESSGTAALLGETLALWFVDLDPFYSLAFFFILTSVMTQLLSNQATAVVMIPVAIKTATVIGVSSMPFIMSVTIAASCCFVTPFEPAFMLVYGPGGYRFTDFFKLGIWLNIMAICVALYVIPKVWLM